MKVKKRSSFLDVNDDKIFSDLSQRQVDAADQRPD